MASRKETLFYVETDFGCCIDFGPSLRAAERSARAREGQYFKKIRHATEDDVAWVGAMGGYVPDGVIRKEKA